MTVSIIGEYLYPLLLPIVLWLFAISLWTYYNNSLKDRSSSCPLPPGNYGLPFVGETLHMVFQGWKFYEQRKQRYGHLYKTHLLGKPTIRIWGTENIQKIFQYENLSLTMSWPTSVRNIVGSRTLSAAVGGQHSTRRALMSRAFTNRAIQTYTIRTEEITANWIAKCCDENSVIQAVPETRKLAFKVSAAILLGVECSAEHMVKLISNINIMIANLFTLAIDVPGTGYHKAIAARKEVLSIIREIIKKKKSYEEKGECLDILSHLLVQCENGHLTHAEVEDGIIENFFSSVNGIPSLCCSTLVHLAKNPQVVEKLHQELKQAELLESDASLTMDNLKELPYLTQVWKEIIRIAAPFGGGFRRVTKTFELEGYQIPAGWTVIYSIRDNHEAEENFDSHADFNPDRWCNNKSDKSWVPYGGKGIRSCIARNYVSAFLAQFVALLVKNSKWELHEANPEFTRFPVLLPRSQLPVVFHHRKAQNC